MRHEGEQLVEFGRLDVPGLRRLRRQAVSRSGDPVGHRLMHHPKMTRNTPQIHPINVHPYCRFTHRRSITVCLRIGGILASTPLAPVALTPQSMGLLTDMLVL